LKRAIPSIVGRPFWLPTKREWGRKSPSYNLPARVEYDGWWRLVVLIIFKTALADPTNEFRA
jgi:hypothetical protein